MDNIQKLIVGVLSVAGMIAFFVPSGQGVAPAATETPPAATATIVEPAPVAEEEEVVTDEEVTEESEMNDEDVFMIGEPAIDGNPLQGNQQNNEAPPAAAQFNPSPTMDYSQSAIVTGQSYATPLAPAPPPAE